MREMVPSVFLSRILHLVETHRHEKGLNLKTVDIEETNEKNVYLVTALL